ncbi:hypothetical protein D3C76_1015590 [compost metagenome]
MGVELFFISGACCHRPVSIVFDKDVSGNHYGSAGREDGACLGDHPFGGSGPEWCLDQVIGNQGQQAHQSQAEKSADKRRLAVGITVESEHRPVPEIQ